MQSLPVDSLLPEIVGSLKQNPNLVIEASPGAGKTTRVPPALLDAGLADGGEVWVLEPRRLAARMAAQRVAYERGEKLGETIGYQVRFQDISSAKTKIRFLTEGIFTRRLLSDPEISKAKIVILDEFHERHLQTDLALALLRRLQKTTRRDLKIVVMSATLDVEAIAKFLGDCPVLISEGRLFDVATEHQKHHDSRLLEEQVADALKHLIDKKLDGDVLVFLPGAAEIRKAREACEKLAAKNDLLLLPLHGELTQAEQDLAINPSEKRKVILSTNVAETSVTIDGVVAVIDSGLARVASHSPWSGLQVLQVARVSKASAIQRAGRAGRTREGKCLRLYTQQDFFARDDYETPEIERLDLTQTVLELHASGIKDLRTLEWFAAPSNTAIEASETLLKKLSALDEKGNITEVGKHMLRYPLPPRLSRMIVEAEKQSIAREACLIAALISERDIRQSQMFVEKKNATTKIGLSDLFELYDLYAEAERANFAADKLRRMDLDSRAVQSVRRVFEQLSHQFEKRELRELTHEEEKKLSHALLAGFPDRVAQRRNTKEAKERDELLLANGDTIQLGQTSVVRHAKFLVAVDVEQRKEKSLTKTYVRLASAVEPDWLLDLFTDSINETEELFWNEKAERVEAVSLLKYEQLILDESRSAAKHCEETEKVLADAVLSAGLEKFIERDWLTNNLARVKFVSQTFPEEEIPLMTEDDAIEALMNLAKGKRSFAEIREAVKEGWFEEELFGKLNDAQKKLLSKTAPERVKLLGGRQVKIHYEENQPPWIESRLQDFFGMTETPKIANGRVSLVVRLLAPNNRPIQITSDLAGFWQRDYQRVRRELSRRYPRHNWDEDPLLQNR